MTHDRPPRSSSRGLTSTPGGRPALAAGVIVLLVAVAVPVWVFTRTMGGSGRASVSDAGVVMGSRADLHPGAVAQFEGEITADRSIAARQAGC